MVPRPDSQDPNAAAPAFRHFVPNTWSPRREFIGDETWPKLSYLESFPSVLRSLWNLREFFWFVGAYMVWFLEHDAGDTDLNFWGWWGLGAAVTGVVVLVLIVVQTHFEYERRERLFYLYLPLHVFVDFTNKDFWKTQRMVLVSAILMYLGILGISGQLLNFDTYDGVLALYGLAYFVWMELNVESRMVSFSTIYCRRDGYSVMHSCWQEMVIMDEDELIVYVLDKLQTIRTDSEQACELPYWQVSRDDVLAFKQRNLEDVRGGISGFWWRRHVYGMLTCRRSDWLCWPGLTIGVNSTYGDYAMTTAMNQQRQQAESAAAWWGSITQYVDGAPPQPFYYHFGDLVEPPYAELSMQAELHKAMAGSPPYRYRGPNGPVFLADSVRPMVEFIGTKDWPDALVLENSSSMAGLDVEIREFFVFLIAAALWKSNALLDSVAYFGDMFGFASLVAAVLLCATLLSSYIGRARRRAAVFMSYLPLGVVLKLPQPDFGAKRESDPGRIFWAIVACIILAFVGSIPRDPLLAVDGVFLFGGVVVIVLPFSDVNSQLISFSRLYENTQTRRLFHSSWQPMLVIEPEVFIPYFVHRAKALQAANATVRKANNGKPTTDHQPSEEWICSREDIVYFAARELEQVRNSNEVQDATGPTGLSYTSGVSVLPPNYRDKPTAIAMQQVRKAHQTRDGSYCTTAFFPCCRCGSDYSKHLNLFLKGIRTGEISYFVHPQAVSHAPVQPAHGSIPMTPSRASSSSSQQDLHAANAPFSHV